MLSSILNAHFLVVIITFISLSHGQTDMPSLIPPSDSSPSSSPSSSPTPNQYPCLSQGKVCEMRSAIRNYYLGLEESEHSEIKADFLGGVVRLSFHDAGTYSLIAKNGGPDGCIDHADPDNGGLLEIEEEVEKLYTPFADRLSRADFWALTAVEAVSVSGGPSMDFRYGRKDCDHGNFTADKGRLPSAVKDYDHIFDVFGTRMGFTDREIVALLGAHTLGRCDPKHSGFEGPWTLKDSPAKFDTQYYLGLLVPWLKAEKEFSEFGHPKTHQWQQVLSDDVPVTQMFLTADIDLIISNADNPECINSQMYEESEGERTIGRDMILEPGCTLNKRTFYIVEEFSESEEAFHDEFKTAFQKLQEIGYESGTLLSPGQCFENADPPKTDPTCPPTISPTMAEAPTTTNAAGDFRFKFSYYSYIVYLSIIFSIIYFTLW